jgi:DNA-binding FrmR family transcriptional regulator
MTPDVRNRAQRRLKIIAGQIEALQRQVEDDRYCMDLLDLSLSVQRALRSLDTLIIEGHLRTHVVEQIESGDVEQSVRELLRLYRVQGPSDEA